MFVATLLICSLETQSCKIVSHPEPHKSEEECYYYLGLGMTFYENKGYEVPVYRCFQLIEDYEKV